MSQDDILKRVPPQNIEAEQSVLGAILLENDAINQVIEILTAEDFYRESHREIFRAMMALSGRNQAVDAITLTDLLRSRGVLEAVGGAGYIAELAACVPTASNIRHYATIVCEKAILRGIASAATQIASEAYDSPVDVREFADRAARAICEIADRGVEDHTLTSEEQIRLTVEAIERAYEAEGEVSGLASGYVDLDRVTSGFQPGQMYVLAGRPGTGKTAFAMNIATRNAKAGRHVVLVSLEMVHEQLGKRRLSSQSRIAHDKLKKGALTEDDFKTLAAADAALSGISFTTDDNSSLTVAGIKAVLRRAAHKQHRPVDLAIIDHIGLVRPPNPREPRERQIALISLSLKQMAKELKIPVLVLAQLNREVEHRDPPRPQLSDLRESGAIEQDADCVMFLWDAESRKPPNERDPQRPRYLGIAKQRDGDTDEFKLTWFNDTVRFESYSDRAAPGGDTLH